MKNYGHFVKISFLAIFFIFVIISGFYIRALYNNSPLILGLMADIHAGDQKVRDDGVEENNILHPVNFEKNMREALANLNDADLIFSLGDNLNRPSRKNARKLVELTKNYPFFWTKGNHDDPDHFKEILSPERYYYIDKKKWRVIVLDNSEKFPNSTEESEEYGRGYVNEEQVKWLKEVLQTKKDIIVILHIPLFQRFNLENIRPEMQYLEDIFIASEKVRYVFFGHFHVHDFQTQRNGIIYRIFPSISLSGAEAKYFRLKLE